MLWLHVLSQHALQAPDQNPRLCMVYLVKKRRVRTEALTVLAMDGERDGLCGGFLYTSALSNVPK